jgi:hypothetical protein
MTYIYVYDYCSVVKNMMCKHIQDKLYEVGNFGVKKSWINFILLNVHILRVFSGKSSRQ